MNLIKSWQLEKKKRYEIYKRIPFKDITCTYPENNTTFILRICKYLNKHINGKLERDILNTQVQEREDGG